MKNAAFVHENNYLHFESVAYVIWNDEAQRMQDAAQNVLDKNARLRTNETRSAIAELEANPLFWAGMVARNVIDSKGISVKRYFADKVEAYNMENEAVALGHAVAAEFGWDMNAMQQLAQQREEQRKREYDDWAATNPLLLQLMNNWDETISN